jgi:Cytochrome c554 and c-prime
MRKITLFAIAMPVVVATLAYWPVEQRIPFHSAAELAVLRAQLAPNGTFLAIDSSILFPTARTCGGCHGFDPNGFALVTTDGRDVNIFDDWRSTMMANSAKDPYWRAKVTHELLVNPTHSEDLQDKCTSCHAPTGHYQAKLGEGAAHYSFYEALTDTLALDGVNCQACHAMAPGPNGSLHSGELNYDPDNIRVAYGPYPQAFAPPMHNFVGITPKFGEHISDAGLCAGCHTLITKSVNLNGQYTGQTFVEQATYHEWLNSRYDSDQDNITCQGCHMPQLQDEIIISANYQFLTPKSPFGLHELAGANVTMLQLLRDNRAALGIGATAAQFDSTIAATVRMLQQQTLDLTLTPVVTQGDTAEFELVLHNKAGHKFPSGYPSRRAWIELEVTNGNGQQVFHTGRLQPDGTIEGEDTQYEPHHQVIRSANQVQIYELVPGDVAGQFTSVLERGHIALKDNRLTPDGFKLSDPVYDTTQIIGGALDDVDFNRFADGTEGSGSDRVHFRIPIQGYTGTFSVTAKVWYQSLPPKWLMPMFAYSSPQIDSFRTMYDQADKSPTLIQQTTLTNVPVTPVSTSQPTALAHLRVTPTVTRDGRIYVQHDASLHIQEVRVWDARGRLVHRSTQPDPIQLPNSAGTYMVEVQTNRGKKVVKVVRI